MNNVNFKFMDDRSLVGLRTRLAIGDFTRAKMQENGVMRRIMPGWKVGHIIVPVRELPDENVVDIEHFNHPRFGYVRVQLRQPRALFVDYTEYQQGVEFKDVFKEERDDYSIPAVFTINYTRSPRNRENLGYGEGLLLETVANHHHAFWLLRELRKAAGRYWPDGSDKNPQLVRELRHASNRVWWHGHHRGLWERHDPVPYSRSYYRRGGYRRQLRPWPTDEDLEGLEQSDGPIYQSAKGKSPDATA